MGFRPSRTSPIFDKIENADRLWVFGYGSILWKTGFKYSTRKLGYVKGFVRRFWQGNTTHRGTPDSPGRVATLVECESEEVWGAAYELVGEEAIANGLDHLGMRECTLGGYAVRSLTFHPHPEGCEEEEAACDVECPCCAIPCLVFIATCQNDLYLGPTSHRKLATQVVSSSGPSGHNVEYVLRLAEFEKRVLPRRARDNHLNALQKRVVKEMIKRGKKISDCLSSESVIVISQSKHFRALQNMRRQSLSTVPSV